MNKSQNAQELSRRFAQADTLSAPLDQRLAQYAEQSREILPEIGAAYDRLVAQLEGATNGAKIRGIGDQLPPFTLPDAGSRLVCLDDLLEKGSVVVSFNRGHWCPYCRLELSALARAAPHLEARGASIVSIVPETGEHRDRLAFAQELPFLVLSDVDLGYTLSLGLMIAVSAEVVEIYREFGIDLPRFQGRDGWFLPIPATYVVGPDRHIKAGFVNPDFRKRMTIEQIEAALGA